MRPQPVLPTRIVTAGSPEVADYRARQEATVLALLTQLERDRVQRARRAAQLEEYDDDGPSDHSRQR